MAKKKSGGDDEAWAGSAVGGDSSAATRPPGSAKSYGQVNRIAEHFWHEMDTVPLSVPRWDSRTRMNANIKWLLDKGFNEDVVKASFSFFRGALPTIVIPAGTSCWEVYFRRRGAFLHMGQRAQEGKRPGERVYKAGDIVVDNDRFRVRKLGEAISDPNEGDE